MKQDRIHFAVRTDRNTLERFKYIAEYNARSANRELELLMKNHIKAFEETHGEIPVQSSNKA